MSHLSCRNSKILSWIKFVIPNIFSYTLYIGQKVIKIKFMSLCMFSIISDSHAVYSKRACRKTTSPSLHIIFTYFSKSHLSISKNYKRNTQKVLSLCDRTFFSVYIFYEFFKGIEYFFDGLVIGDAVVGSIAVEGNAFVIEVVDFLFAVFQQGPRRYVDVADDVIW